MAVRHKQDEPVKAYLLGTLDERRSVALEQRFFVDPEYLKRIRTIETALIEDFLQNRLPAGDRKLFEERYLAVPQLAHRVAEVRAELVVRPHRPAWLRWSLAGAAAALVLAGGVGYLRVHPRAALPAAAVAKVAESGKVFTLRLTPGIMKDAEMRSVSMTAQPAGTVVRFVLELPGQNALAKYQTQLLAIAADGRRAPVWESREIRAAVTRGATVLSVDLDAGLMRPGLYLLRASSNDETLETYLFRVNPAR